MYTPSSVTALRLVVDVWFSRACAWVETVTKAYGFGCRAPGSVFSGYARQRNPYACGVAQPRLILVADILGPHASA